MTAYRRRVLDSVLDEFHPALAAVSLSGPKGVGKTATAVQRARSVLSFDLDPDRQRYQADPDVIERLPGPVLLDG